MTIRGQSRPAFVTRGGIQELIDHLREGGYQCLGPVVADGAIQFREVVDLAQFPRGVQNDQQPGDYRLSQTTDERLFAWNHGPQAIKPLCFAPQEVLWTERRGQDQTLGINAELPDLAPTAIIGVRACDLAALALQDRHFLEGVSPDPHYQARRQQLLLIGVDCAQSAQTCFCASTGDGPALDGRFDIGLAELAEGYLVWAGSGKGRPWVEGLSRQRATDAQLAAMLEATDHAAMAQTRHLPSEQKQRHLYQRLDHSHWQEVARRCLSCGNCTAVCPTCFCYSNTHAMGLMGDSAQMIRRWDSCFSPTLSDMGHFQVRKATDQRYRQWLTHKLAGWQEQLGRSGCVGCGRCLTWCPVGIDLTQEVAEILYEGSHDE